MVISHLINSAAYALQANGRRVQAVANNLANLNTSDFVPSDVRTVITAGPAITGATIGGVTGGITTVIVEGGNNDPAEQFVRLIQARTAYSAAAKTLVVAEEISRETANIAA